MAGQHSSRRNRRERTAKAGRRRAVGLGTSAGAFLTFGMGPLATAPAANADEFDLITDPIINSLSGSLAGAVDSFAGLADPSAGLDLGGLGLGTADVADTSGVGVGSADLALSAALSAPGDPGAYAAAS